MFEIMPAVMSFGDLIGNGATYRLAFTLSNVGNDSARFRIGRRTSLRKGQQEQTHTLRVLYRPGPLAPGMRARLLVEITTGENGTLTDEVEIITEHRIFRLPVRARVTHADNLAPGVRKMQGSTTASDLKPSVTHSSQKQGMANISLTGAQSQVDSFPNTSNSKMKGNTGTKKLLSYNAELPADDREAEELMLAQMRAGDA